MNPIQDWGMSNTPEARPGAGAGQGGCKTIWEKIKWDRMPLNKLEKIS